MEDLLLLPSEVAAALKLSRTKVYLLIKSGKIPSIKIGGNVRVSVQALRAYITDLHRQQGQPTSALESLHAHNRTIDRFVDAVANSPYGDGSAQTR